MAHNPYIRLKRSIKADTGSLDMIWYKLNLLPAAEHSFAILTTAILSCLVATGCNETFEPWEENDQYHFSIFGYLDASADTQWVRVMPVREEFFLDPDQSLDAKVTLEHVESGESVIMNDSLFAYAHDVYAWNFWTTMDVQPEQTYRLTVKHPNNPGYRSSSVETTLPPDFPPPLVQIDFDALGNPVNTTVFVKGVDRLADVQTVFHPTFPVSGKEYLVRLSHLQDSLHTSSGEFRILIDPLEDFQHLDTYYRLNPSVTFSQYLNPSSAYGPQQIFIASAGPDYHFFPSIDQKIVALPEGVSNIENGVGYLSGIVSKTVPYQTCMEEGTIILIPCEPEAPPW